MALAYFITFHTYGTWLHGVAKGSVEPGRNRVGTPFVPEDPVRLKRDSEGMRTGALVFNARQRREVERAMREVCEHRAWRLLAINARTNHVHVVVAARERPELVLNAFKSWATRALRERGLVGSETKVWSRHGSTRWLTTDDSVVAACDYVTRLQGSDAVRHRMGVKGRSETPGNTRGERE